MSERRNRPRTRIRTIRPPSLRLYRILQTAGMRLDDCLLRLRGRTELRPADTTEVLLTLRHCHRATSRETVPVWLGLIPKDRAPSLGEVEAILLEARKHLTRVRELWHGRLLAAGIDFGQGARGTETYPRDLPA